MSDQANQVEEMIAKAAKADKSDDALKFSQAACNAAAALEIRLQNAMCALETAKNLKAK